jgi:carbamoyltransferase
MIILGINGYHGDAAACIVVDGQLIAAAEEERFRRIKHWAGMPTEAIRYCLDAAQVGLDEVDHIAINRDPKANLLKKVLYAFSKRPGLAAIKDRLTNAAKVQDLQTVLANHFQLSPSQLRATIHRVEHHFAHFASTFYVSPFDQAAIASIDGFGDFVSTMVGVGEGSYIRTLDQVSFPYSLGMLYLAMTQYLGFPAYGDEYKVMGLAACGKPNYVEALNHIVRLEPGGKFSLKLDYFLHHSEGVAMTWENGEPVVGRMFSDQWVHLLGPPRRKDEEITDRHADLAASLQYIYEEAFFHILEDLAQRTQYTNLCLAGGCALNSVANGQIFKRSSFKQIYIPPAAGDAGGAIGAAYSIWNGKLGHPRSFVMDRHDWGPEFTDSDIRSLIHRRENELVSLGWQIQMLDDLEKRCRWTAEQIASGKVVGWFQGRMEWGARALGHRSILADPRRPDMKDILNARIKRREMFRPFAPSVLDEAVGEYFDETTSSPFMTMTYRVRRDKQDVIPATIHVDGTARLQTVAPETDPLYWQLIKEFERLTGVPVILNTSFNENEPIVCSPQEALDCFLRTKMDVLVLGPFAICAQASV